MRTFFRSGESLDASVLPAVGRQFPEILELGMMEGYKMNVNGKIRTYALLPYVQK